MSSDNKEQEIDIEIKVQKFTGWRVLGVILFLFSICYVVYNYEILFEGKGLKDNESDTILGVAAFFASASGILFVIDNLSLQRKTLESQIHSNKLQLKEFKQQLKEAAESNVHFQKQNETLISQQADNTFFNLLDLHKKLVDEINGKELLNSITTRTKKDFIDYKKNVIDAEKIKSVYLTHYNPYFKLCIDKNNQNNRLSNFIINVNDIIEYVDDKLKSNAEFYHKIFYNLFSVEEKYLIGLCMEFKMFGINKTEKFDYQKHFRESEQFVYEMGYLPPFTYSLIPEEINLNQNYMNYFFDLNAYIQEIDKNIVLRKTHIEILNHRKQENHVFMNLKLDTSGPIIPRNSINIKKVIDYISSSLEDNETYALRLIFYIKSYDKEYEIEETINFNISKDRKLNFRTSKFYIN